VIDPEHGVPEKGGRGKNKVISRKILPGREAWISIHSKLECSGPRQQRRWGKGICVAGKRRTDAKNRLAVRLGKPFPRDRETTKRTSLTGTIRLEFSKTSKEEDPDGEDG